MLKTEKVEYIEVDYHDLEWFIIANLPGFEKYDIIADNELNNDSCYIYTIGTPYSFDKEDIDRVLNGVTKNEFGSEYSIRIILDALYSKGLIESGNYLIRVSW